MAFTLSGTVITQTGTDINLSGLSAISGVTTTTRGHQTIYDINTRKLIISGVLSHDPDIELLISNHSATSAMDITGVYNYGVETIQNGNSRLSGSTGLIFTGLTTTSQGEWRAYDFGGLVVKGGTLNALGGVIVSSRCHGFYSDSSSSADGNPVPTVDIKLTRFIKRGTTARREFRFDNNVQINGFIDQAIIDGFQVSHRETPQGGLILTLLDGEIVQLSGGPTLTELENLDTSGNIAGDTDLGTDDNQNVSRNYNVTNASNGSGTRLMPKSGVSNTRQRGYLQIFKELSFNFFDGSNNNALIDGVQLYIKDNNNGFRKNANGLNNLADNVYRQTSILGVISPFSVKTAITNIDSEGAFAYSDWDTNSHNNRYKVDRRGIDDSTDDILLNQFYSYNHGLSSSFISCKGLGVLNTPWTLFIDTLITEPDMATALAFVQHPDVFSIYDQQKAQLVSNPQGESETRVDRTGDTLEARNLNIIINSGSGVSIHTTTSLTIFNFNSGALNTTGSVTDNTASGLINYSVTNTLIINDASIEWTIDGGTIGNIINNDPNNNLVVNLINGAIVSSTEEGNENGQVTIRQVATVSFEILDSNNNPIENARIEIQRRDNLQRFIAPLQTDVNGIATAEINFTGNVEIIGWVRQNDLIGNDYVPQDYAGTITQEGFSRTIILTQINT